MTKYTFIIIWSVFEDYLIILQKVETYSIILPL